MSQKSSWGNPELRLEASACDRAFSVQLLLPFSSPDGFKRVFKQYLAEDLMGARSGFTPACCDDFKHGDDMLAWLARADQMARDGLGAL